MTTELIWLFVASCLFNGLIGYWLWSVVRTAFFREELFAVRDHLWDRVRSLDGFDDEAYKQVREDLNAAIQVASWVNVPVFLHLAGKGPTRHPTRVRSANPALQAALDDAIRDAAAVYFKYLFRRSILGITLFGFCKAILLVDRLRDTFDAWFRSSGPRSATLTTAP